MCLPFCIFMMSWSLKLNWSGLLFCFCSSLPLWSTSTMSSIPQGTVFALLLALFLCGVHWVQCSSVQWSSHVGSVGSVSSVSLEAVWLDQVAVPDLWYQSPVVAATTVGCVSPLCSCPFLTLHVLYSFFFCCSCFSDSRHSSPQLQTVKALLWMASSCTSGGSVRCSVALQTASIVPRMTHSTLQIMADRQTDRPGRRACRQTMQDRLGDGFVTESPQNRKDEFSVVCGRTHQHECVRKTFNYCFQFQMKKPQ